MDDILKAAGGVLGAVAPMIASAFGGPLAGAATSAIIGALGLAPDASKEAVAQAVVAATPEQLIALKKADNDFRAQMRQLDITEEQLSYTDRASARERETAVKDQTPSILAYGLTCGFFGLLGFATFKGFPPENAALLNIMIGSLGTAWAGAISYYFGSSAGSQAKDATLAASVPASSVSALK